MSTVILLNGCTALAPGQRPAPRLFQLAPQSRARPELPRADWQLVIETPSASAGIDSFRIALMRQAYQLEYYARANWTARAPLMVQTLLVESFENSGRIVSIGRESLGLRADYLLRSELRHFQAEYDRAGEPPLVRVAIVLRLVRVSDRSIVGTTSLMATARAAADSIVDVVAAFEAATEQVLEEAVAWTLRSGEADRSNT